MQFLSLLTILFIGLKLAGFISWSWFFVLLPLGFIPVLFLVLILIVVIGESRQ